MAFSVLLVDDEMPALRFMQAVIEKYLPELAVAEKLTTGAQALSYLERHPADLLITDISMPGMDGITLSKAVRAAYPDMHIVIVSGYAEFDYARGALSVAADDYLLKPLSIPHVTESLKKVCLKLSDEYRGRTHDALCALASGERADLPDALLAQRYCFALVRQGNLPAAYPVRLRNTRVLPAPEYPFSVLQGTDEEERVILSSQGFDPFHTDFLLYMVHWGAMPYTAVLNRIPMPLLNLRGFIEKAAQRMEKRLIIGRRQVIYLEDKEPAPPSMDAPAAVLRKLEHFILSANMKMVKETFFSLAAQWERQQCTQHQAAGLIYPLVQQALLANPALGSRQEGILRETSELIQCAASYASLMAGLFDILFNDDHFHDKRLSPRELCEYTMNFIRENHAQPLSVQSVCAEVGVSQTYLSRLMRKYGDTSFSAYLTQCRMDAAVALMRQHPGMLLRDVAACVGYDDPSYFSKVFHQAIGKTPTQFALDMNETIA